MFKLIDESNGVEELKFQNFEDTTILEMEVVHKFKEDKIKKLQLKKVNLEEDVQGLKDELCQMRIAFTKSSTIEKKLFMALCASCIAFVVIYFLK